jgi:putative membrane protein
MTRSIPVLLALGASLCLAASATAQKSAAVSASDRKFITEAAQGGMAEVKLGNLALKNAQSTDVKSFGQHMVEDHSKANEELTGLAKSKNVTLPADVKPSDKALYNRLAKLHGTAFDKLYISEMVKDHKKDVSEFQHASTTAKDAELKAWAGKTLPTLEHHLQMAQEQQTGLATGKTAKKK